MAEVVSHFERSLGDRTLSIETGKVANQAHGAVTVRYGDSVVLVTACAGEEMQNRYDFLPLTVDYEERLYAAGKIPGGFFRREGRPTAEATLVARLTDRSLRPLFLKGFRRETQVIITTLSADHENDLDTLALTGASAALYISDIPFLEPVGAVRLGYIDGKLVVNPSLAQLADSYLDLLVASTEKSIIMIEGQAKQVQEDLILEALELGHKANQQAIALQKEMRQACGKSKMDFKPVHLSEGLADSLSSLLGGKLTQAVNRPRSERQKAIAEVRDEMTQRLVDRFAAAEVANALELELKKEVRRKILRTRQHFDDRLRTEIRTIGCEVGLLPRTHGSALFTRGETQVLTITTLGSPGEEQKLDGLGIAETKRFMHHYNFPPFSTGEVKRIGTGRREIGHGALVERGIAPVLVDVESFPYTIRLVSEVLSSNGSTSMASACASSLSLMDAGVPIKAPVAGVAMGLVTGESGEYVVLTDIEGMEDFYGDMDFKITGTAEGVTAVQLDTKLSGISFQILRDALKEARQAHATILGKMTQAIPASRREVSRYAPRMYTLTVPVEKIGQVIGPGGKTIRKITCDTKTTINIEDDGKVTIGATSEASAQQAIAAIEGLTRSAEVGQVYTGKVSRILNFGAMVEILPGREGLVHISELADYRVGRVEDVVKVGDEIMVKVIGVDSQGRVNLSRKAVFSETSEPSAGPRRESGPPRPGGPPGRGPRRSPEWRRPEEPG